MEKESAKREIQHLAQLKKMEPFRKRAFASLKQELKAKTDLIKQTKGLGDALKKTGAGLGSMFKTLGSSISKAMSGLGAGFKGGISAGLSGILQGLKSIDIMGVSVGKILGVAATAAKTLYDIMMNYQNLMRDLVKQTGQFVDNTGKITTEQKTYRDSMIESYKVLGKYGYELKDVVKMTQDLRETFGDVSYVTNDLVQASAELQISYRMAGDEANNLVAATERAGLDARAFHKTMKETAIVMGADVGMAMRDAAKNSQMIELYAGRGAEYFATMASRAALLGTSMSVLEKSGDIFGEFDQAAEAVGRMSQLFGEGFDDGLKDLNDLRMMWERGDMLGIQEHMAEQAGKTLYFQDGILKSERHREKLMRSQIQAHAKLMSTDEVTAKRMLEAGAIVAKMKEKGFDLDEQGYEKIREAYKSEYDFVLALKGTTDKTNQEIMDAIGASPEGLVGLLEASQKEIKRRTDEAKKAADLPQQTLAQMSDLTKAMNAATQAITLISLEAGKGLEASVGEYIKRFGAATGAMSDALRDGLTGWLGGDEKSRTLASLTDVFKNAGGAGLEEALPDIFKPGSTADQSFAGMMERGLVGALGGTDEQGLWGIMKERMMEAWDYGVEKFTGMLRTSWRWLEDIFDDLVFNLRQEIDKMSIIGTGGDFQKSIGWDYQQGELAKARDRAKKPFEDQIEAAEDKYYALRKIEDRTKEQEATFNELSNTLSELSRQMDDAGAAAFRARREALKTSGEWVTKEQVAQEQDIDVSQVGKVRKDDSWMDVTMDNLWKMPWEAKGSAGGPHTAIVGEAGTEVGITKSALRELSSIGIPGYANGYVPSSYESYYSEKGLAMSSRAGLGGAAGSVAVRDSRAVATQAAGERYLNQQREFLENLWDLQRSREQAEADGHDIAMQRQKEFFTKYPALIDQVFGEPFRAGGPVIEGLYNATFSGMQAYARTELAGGSKKEARAAMAQHAVAEGIKKGGTIHYGLSKMNSMQAELQYSVDGGLEKQRALQEKLVEETPKIEQAVIDARV